MAKKKTAKEIVSDAAVKTKKVTDKISKAAKETKEEEKENVAKEAEEAKVATKSFFKEVGEFFLAIFKVIGKFFKKLFTKDK